MDVIPIDGPEDHTIVLETQSLGETSNDRSDVESPVLRLPTELIVHIFRHCSPKIKDRLILTHTCGRWRCIAINDASLWTQISIVTVGVNENARLDHFLSFLGMQLDRTANLLLDVKLCFPDVEDKFSVAAFQIMREKAPICRWKTLRVQIDRKLRPNARWHALNAPWHALDAPWSAPNTFTSLELLHVVDRAMTPIIRGINRATTSRLKFLEVDYPVVIPAQFVTHFARPLTLISSLHLHLLSSIPHMPFLPANVVKLRLDWVHHHPFPHIQTYTLRRCTFTEMNCVDLRNMTTLIVDRYLTIDYDVQVSLPALRELKLGGLEMFSYAKIEAPALDILYFRTPFDFDVNDNSKLLSDTDWSLQETGYLLSPNTSIIADSYLPSRTLIKLLAKSPKVIHATLRFDNWSDARAVLKRLVGFKGKSKSDSAKNQHLCLRLSELRLDFGWKLSERSKSKKWLLNRLKSRREAGAMVPLSIYARWKREGTYVQLTGD